MKRNWLCLLVAASLPVAPPVSAVDGKAHTALQVYEARGECTVAERTVDCLDLLRVLRELGVKPDQLIVVSAQGSGENAQSRADEVAAMIRAGGYQNVSTGGFHPGPARTIPRDS